MENSTPSNPWDIYKRRMDYKKAKNIANRLVEILSPVCTKVDIAGSIRREKPEVKDIEICCIPLYQDIGLFSDYKIVDRRFMEAAATFIDTVEKGKFDGRYMAIKLKGCDIKLDLFLPKPDDYYRQFAIRTGSNNYSQQVIAKGWVKKGWVGVPEIGLRKETDCVGTRAEDGKMIWRLVNHVNPEMPPAWTSEEDFFNWIDVPFLEPKLRS